MKLGLLTAPLPDLPLEEVADWTAANGFTAIEIACWPATSGDTRRYAGTSHIDVDGLSDTKASEIVDQMNTRGLEISGLGFYPNPLHPDDEHARTVIDHLKKVIVAAGAEWREAGCSMCIGMNGDIAQPGQLSVSTSNRNFEGRQGVGARTVLASPATAAASAIAGHVADPRTYS